MAVSCVWLTNWRIVQRHKALDCRVTLRRLGRKYFSTVPNWKIAALLRRLRSRRRIKSNVNNFSLFSHNAWFKVSLLPIWRPLWFILPYQRQNIEVGDSNCSFFRSRRASGDGEWLPLAFVTRKREVWWISWRLDAVSWALMKSHKADSWIILRGMLPDEKCEVTTRIMISSVRSRVGRARLVMREGRDGISGREKNLGRNVEVCGSTEVVKSIKH